LVVIETTDSTDTEVLIIGAGPIGLELGAALARHGIEHEIIDAGPIGHTMTWWAPGTQFFSSPERLAIAGVPLVTRDQQKATREEYLDYLRQVAGAFDLRVRTFERAIGIRRMDSSEGHGVVVRTVPSRGEASERAPAASERELRCRYLVLATGNMDTPRRLEIPGENLPHVSHYLRDPHGYYGREVLIVGGKNSAVEAAIRLYRVGARVTMSYRRDGFDHERVKYWLWPELEWLIEKGRIGFEPRTAPVEITPERVVLATTSAEGAIDPEAPTRALAPDFVLLLTGYVQDPSLFEMLGVELTGPERRPAHDRRTMETGVPGVYVAGTAVGGSQRRARVFIETSHVHVDRIVASISGQPPPADHAPAYGRAEES